MSVNQTPSIHDMRSVHLCGVLWIVALDQRGKIDTVSINGQWLDAHDTLRHTLVDWIERTMLAEEVAA